MMNRIFKGLPKWSIVVMIIAIVVFNLLTIYSYERKIDVLEEECIEGMERIGDVAKDEIVKRNEYINQMHKGIENLVEYLESGVLTEEELEKARESFRKDLNFEKEGV